jgi:hypothetical protein
LHRIKKKGEFSTSHQKRNGKELLKQLTKAIKTKPPQQVKEKN